MDDFRQMLAQLRQFVVSAPLCSNCKESSDEAVEEFGPKPAAARQGR
jgi:hypothetical protein